VRAGSERSDLVIDCGARAVRRERKVAGSGTIVGANRHERNLARLPFRQRDRAPPVDDALACLERLITDADVSRYSLSDIINGASDFWPRAKSQPSDDLIALAPRFIHHPKDRGNAFTAMGVEDGRATERRKISAGGIEHFIKFASGIAPAHGIAGRDNRLD
jgi:hypothetical protein